MLYFPSYEIAMSNGSNSFIDDNVHVNTETVNQIMSHLLGGAESDNETHVNDRTYIDGEASQRIHS